MDDTDQLHQDLFPVLDRLVTAGWSLGWSCASGSIDVRWNPDHNGGLGGEAAFQDFVELLSQLCPKSLLSESEQAMLLILDLSVDGPPKDHAGDEG